MSANSTTCRLHIAHLQQQCHNSKCVILQEKNLKVLKCYNFLRVQQRLNCLPEARFENCLMTLNLLKVHLQTFLSIPITQKYPNLSCDTLVANERCVCVCVHCSLSSIVGPQYFGRRREQTINTQAYQRDNIFYLL